MESLNLSIISNNCTGWRLLEALNQRYDTPTIAIQILPEEFAKFCKNLDYYLKQDIVEYKDFSEEHKQYLLRMFGCILDCPYGLCGDICIVFQHETNFIEAKTKWDRRKARVHMDNLTYVFCLDFPQYQKEAQEFSDANLPRSFIFTRDFDIDGKHYRYTVPNKRLCYLDKDRSDHYLFEGDLRREDLWS